ncbi:MAG: gliding motility-associated C-terminal domain-containing protein, partial [Bacteroidota bacterium]|nr:gliding motility-associated C-terminal domain-containing protein [Bacteroidota bacterium]
GRDTSFCVGTSGVMLSASGGNDYIWRPAAGLSNTAIPNPLAKPASATSYIVSVGITGCNTRKEDTLLVTPLAAPAVTITNDTLICSNDILQLFASSPNAIQFSWKPNYSISNQNIASPLVSPDVHFTYYIQVTDANKCVNTDSVFIDVKQFVSIATRTDTTICQGDAVQLNTISDALHYSWSPTSTLDDNTVKSPTATPSNSTTYSVIGNIGKCQNTDAVTITVVPYPKAFAGADTSICFNGSIVLHATGGSVYTWSPATSLSDPNIPDPVASPGSTATYTVTVTDTLGCPKPVIDDVMVTVFPKIMADAGPRDTLIVINEPLQLQASGGQFFTWKPPRGLSNPNIANPLATLNTDQQYILTAVNAAGCSGTDTIDVKVYRVPAGLYVPNAFSPNGDNLNEIFTAVPLGMKSLAYFRIYNRFGQLMFSTKQLNKGWDGSFNQKPQPPDIYVWIVEGVDYSGNKITKRGTVMLVR